MDVISKITEVTVDALTAAWNWILEHKEIVVGILSIVGVIVAVIGFVFEASLALLIGVSILVGELISGLFSWILGNELFSDEMLFDMLVGGITGGISALFGWVAGIGVAGSSVVRWLGTKIPWLGRIFPKMFGGGVMAGVDQSLWDFLKNGKINWIRTVIATGVGFVLVFGGETLGSHSDELIKWINNRNVPNLEQSFFSNSGNSLSTTVPKRIGDTPLGEWLQKFASNGRSTETIKNIKHPVLDNTRSGSALKQPDGQHGFNDIIDNYARYAKKFDIVGGDGVKRKLYQIESGIKYYDYKDVYNKELRIKERIAVVKDQNGIFEWIVDPVKGVTHRRFIPNGKITGIPNQRPQVKGDK